MPLSQTWMRGTRSNGYPSTPALMNLLRRNEGADACTSLVPVPGSSQPLWSWIPIWAPTGASIWVLALLCGRGPSDRR